MKFESFELQGSLGFIRGTISAEVAKTRGTLICLHGQPNGDLHGNSGFFDELAILANELNFAVVQFSFCGASPSDGLPEHITLKSQAVDYSSVVSFVRKKSSSPLHIVGESAGATVAALQWDDEVASYILLWPAFDLSDTDLKPFLTDEYRALAKRDGKIIEHGAVLGSDFIEEIATNDFSRCFELPDVDVLIGHGGSDPEVPYSQSIRALSTAKRKMIFVSHPDADHGFKELEARKYLMGYITKWLETH